MSINNITESTLIKGLFENVSKQRWEKLVRDFAGADTECWDIEIDITYDRVYVDYMCKWEDTDGEWHETEEYFTLDEYGVSEMSFSTDSDDECYEVIREFLNELKLGGV